MQQFLSLHYIVHYLLTAHYIVHCTVSLKRYYILYTVSTKLLHTQLWNNFSLDTIYYITQYTVERANIENPVELRTLDLFFQTAYISLNN